MTPPPTMAAVRAEFDRLTAEIEAANEVVRGLIKQRDAVLMETIDQRIDEGNRVIWASLQERRDLAIIEHAEQSKYRREA